MEKIKLKKALLLFMVLLIETIVLIGCGSKKKQNSIASTENKTQSSTQTVQADTQKPTQSETQKPTQVTTKETESTTDSKIDKNGSYTKKEDVALYIRTYGTLPENFITKAEAKKLGWDGGSLEPYAKGKCIGGDKFGNHEGILPMGEQYYECDIDTLGAASRGAKRIVFTKSGNIYYTQDHYETFEKLY